MDDLVCQAGDAIDKSDIVIELGRIKYKADGHWLIPTPYLPTSVNDVRIKGHVLLSQGNSCRWLYIGRVITMLKVDIGGKNVKVKIRGKNSVNM